jgi:putative SOS response-associated peptidase YedK
MCGRFTQRYTWSEVLQFLRVFGPPRNLQPHYNIAPTMTVPFLSKLAYAVAPILS